MKLEKEKISTIKELTQKYSEFRDIFIVLSLHTIQYSSIQILIKRIPSNDYKYEKL